MFSVTPALQCWKHSLTTKRAREPAIIDACNTADVLFGKVEIEITCIARNRIGQSVAIDQRALFAQSSLNFGNEGISLVSLPRGRNSAGPISGECRAHDAKRCAWHLIGHRL
jgi:hypothetical protein